MKLFDVPPHKKLSSACCVVCVAEEGVWAGFSYNTELN